MGLAVVGAFPSLASWLPAAVDAQVVRGPMPQRHGNVDDLKPGALLVSSRSLGDPNFVRTVILLVHHDEDGAMGLVLNRQTDIPIGRVFESIEAAREHTAPVFIGGPVAQTGAQALVRSSSAIADGRRVTGEVYVLGSAEALTRRVSGAIDADRFRLYLGYAGWGPGQLEDEVDDDAWHIFEGDAGVVFDRDPDTLWLRQIRRADVQMVWAPPVAPARGRAWYRGGLLWSSKPSDVRRAAEDVAVDGVHDRLARFEGVGARLHVEDDIECEQFEDVVMQRS